MEESFLSLGFQCYSITPGFYSSFYPGRITTKGLFCLSCFWRSGPCGALGLHCVPRGLSLKEGGAVFLLMVTFEEMKQLKETRLCGPLGIFLKRWSSDIGETRHSSNL